MLSIEIIEQELKDFFAIKRGILEILPGDIMSDHNIDDFDLVDFEIELEEKYSLIDKQTECAGLSSEDTLTEVAKKLFNFITSEE